MSASLHNLSVEDQHGPALNAGENGAALPDVAQPQNNAEANIPGHIQEVLPVQMQEVQPAQMPAQDVAAALRARIAELERRVLAVPGELANPMIADEAIVERLRLLAAAPASKSVELAAVKKGHHAPASAVCE